METDISHPDTLEYSKHGRMTKVVAFEVAMTAKTIEELLDGEKDGANVELLPETAVEPELLAVIRGEVEDGQYKLFFADSGRGASGYSVALEVVRLIADVGGAIAVVAGGVQLTRRLFDRLRHHLGHPPVISLGAACYLAAAAMVERVETSDFTLHGAGDTRGRPPDSSYTGNDCFFVIFERGSDLYFYAVDAYGEVMFLGTAQMPCLSQPVVDEGRLM